MNPMIKNVSIYQRTELFLVGFCFIISLVFLMIDQVSPHTYTHFLSSEDGPIESLTVIFLLMSGCLCLQRARDLEFRSKCGYIVFSLFLFFVAGEEISWGQRIMQFSTPKIFQEYNVQNEFNLHNLKLFGFKVNRVVFGNLFEFSVLAFLLITPVLYRKSDRFRNLFDNYSIPCPGDRLVVGYILSLQLILFMDSHRKWEAMELIQSVACFLVILNPVTTRKNPVHKI